MEYAESARREANELSRNKASHDKEPWLDYEIEVLLEWDQTDDGLTDAAELLGRTREACRQRYYDTLAGRCSTARNVRVTVTRTTTTCTTTEEEYRVCSVCYLELPAAETGNTHEECE